MSNISAVSAATKAIKPKLIKASALIAAMYLGTWGASFAEQSKPADLKASDAQSAPKAIELKADAAWYGNNRERINKMMQDYGKSSPSYDPNKKPVALFDWDNTMMKNDVGDASFFWLIANNGLKRPKAWTDNPYLEEVALKELEKNCPGTSDKLQTSGPENKACADSLLSIYTDGKLADGKTAAWKKLSSEQENHFDPAFIWLSQLMQGYTPDEVKDIAKKMYKYNSNNPLNAKQKLGSKEYTAYVRIYEQMKNLVSSLQANGFDVYVVSASPQDIVEVVGNEVGIDKDHVIGVRSMLDDNGRYTDSFVGCGPFPDGNKEIISYRQGKRCFINKEIFKVTDPAAMMNQPSPSIFAAGDSNGDTVFIPDAKYHFVQNRNKDELMCMAYENKDKNWIINPMFIEPLAKKSGSYDCSKFGISNQEDKVFH